MNFSPNVHVLEMFSFFVPVISANRLAVVNKIRMYVCLHDYFNRNSISNSIPFWYWGARLFISIFLSHFHFVPYLAFNCTRALLFIDIIWLFAVWVFILYIRFLICHHNHVKFQMHNWFFVDDVEQFSNGQCIFNHFF